LFGLFLFGQISRTTLAPIFARVREPKKIARCEKSRTARSNPDKDQSKINAAHLNIFSGSFVFRNIRGSSALSMHAYGIAVDIAAGLGTLGTPYNPKTMLPMDVIKAFETESWIWGGRWKGRPDCMHFQAAIVG